MFNITLFLSSSVSGPWTLFLSMLQYSAWETHYFILDLYQYSSFSVNFCDRQKLKDLILFIGRIMF